MKNLFKPLAALSAISLLFTGCAELANSTLTSTQSDKTNDAKIIKTLIIDGQNNHFTWPKSTMMMKQNLEQTGLFTVDVQRSQFTWKGEKLIEQFPLTTQAPTQALPEPKADPNFKPSFENYDVVISNFGWKAAPLPVDTQKSLEKFVKNGGGLVVVHAADNSWPKWPAYNEMIGLGAWGGRNEKSGPFVYYDKKGNLVRDFSPGAAGFHKKRSPLKIELREPHPITKGLPPVFMHGIDELYEKLRGPAKNMTILATSYATASKGGEGKHEPVLMVIEYGKGRIFHTTLGHDDTAHESVSLITAIQRGTEWAATGKVTQAVPSDFPTADTVSNRKFTYKPLN
ncbi:ThuA domain-containing protein [Algibacillus agarilyticus]|uniref:ThuA domain-containing protein n=1 Tax=Algibacillus agarilyticus TaxID=2234133 RepID=UPI000DD0773E|nr:ThuA domain-containing protein [Algibacillus agarilyticus]